MPPLFHNLTPETRCTPSAAYDAGAGLTINCPDCSASTVIPQGNQPESLKRMSSSTRKGSRHSFKRHPKRKTGLHMGFLLAALMTYVFETAVTRAFSTPWLNSV